MTHHSGSSKESKKNQITRISLKGKSHLKSSDCVLLRWGECERRETHSETQSYAGRNTSGGQYIIKWWRGGSRASTFETTAPRQGLLHRPRLINRVQTTQLVHLQIACKKIFFFTKTWWKWGRITCTQICGIHTQTEATGAAYIIIKLFYCINAPGNPLAVTALLFIHQTNYLMQITIFNMQIDMFCCFVLASSTRDYFFFLFLNTQP